MSTSILAGRPMRQLGACPRLCDALFALAAKKDKLPLELCETLEAAAQSLYTHESGLLDPRTRPRLDAAWALEGYHRALDPLVEMVSKPPRCAYAPWVKFHKELHAALCYMLELIHLQPKNFAFEHRCSLTLIDMIIEVKNLI